MPRRSMAAGSDGSLRYNGESVDMNDDKKKGGTGLRVLLIILAVLIVAAGGLLVFNNQSMKAVDPSDDTAVIVEIPEGSYTASIAETLSDAGLIRNTMIFRIQSRLRGKDGSYVAGSYELNKAMTMTEIMDKIAAGDTTGLHFQVLEGQTIDKVADQLEEEGVIDREDFYYEVEHGEFDYPFMELLPEGPTRLEGFLYPNTYTLPLDATAHDVIDAMLKSFDDEMNKEGIYDKVEAAGTDLYTVIIKASIAQREAGSAEEMPNVVSVINNRITIGMPLQMDSIIAYIKKEDKIRATYSDIQVESDYNPYKNYGLPPWPICAPGMDAVKAALEPADTEYLYFVASPEMDGTNRYSVTYEDFLKDKAEFDEAYEKYIQEHPDQE